MQDSIGTFEAHRGFLTGLAYRMLGSVAEAEDAVQDAYLRWHAADRGKIANMRAWLSTVVTRLSLDRLKSAQTRRETYVGAWLPEPLVNDPSLITHPPETLDRDISMALMLALERLTPMERAAFLLHDVFDTDFREVADILGTSADACRQLASRARKHIKQGSPRFAVSDEERQRVAEAFFASSRSGDIGQLMALLSEEATLTTDGGGRKIAALNPIYGREKIGRFFQGLARKREQPKWRKSIAINGLPGWVTVEADGTLQTLALDICDGRVEAIYITRNPDKLAHLLPLVPPEYLAAG